MISRRILLGAFALAIAATTGCSSDEAPQGQLPDASGLLEQAATATAGITSTHFSLQVNGTVPGLSVQNLEGDLTTEGGPSGAAQGTGKVALGGQLVEVEFVLAEEDLYIKGPTGSFQKLPAALGAGVYDPSAVLDPERGVANVLRSVQDPATQAQEEINGVQAYKVTGTVTKDVLAGLLPGAPSGGDITLWLHTEGEHLPVKASVALQGEGGEPATVDVTLSDVDKPVTVTPPA
ncbi:lipoprotein LprG [Amycolatopsis marina]|uniref:Lipoprotein LprG n=1 Tax=Amycolatopsis marina TaxID=490629 RepID=A0A1I1AB59_9PSEU|nr:LppX_LprAFG lipoprotein [Amycolatopsis marina]SFB33720.1 lipoprotein LprG [Amycolatopsis marina]